MDDLVRNRQPRLPLHCLELGHVRQEARAAAVDEDVAAEAIDDALHGEGALVGVAEAPVVLALRMDQHRRDGGHVGQHDAKAAGEAAVAQRLLEPGAVVGGEALWAARVDDLQSAPTVGVECLECGHKSEVAVVALAAKLPGWYRVTEIWRVVRCEKCGAKGRASIDARRALGYVS